MPSPDQWTEDAIRALGTFTTLQTAARIFGISQATAYRLARDNEFPVAAIKVGGGWRVPVAAILAAAHLPTGDATTAT
ncbi:hypothetical protein Cs7R123_79560 [Catellatospora sp. TT07R-123]|uniref:helix-turn-helix domain-containing protein n=1 Tax=Catellatospora sp. TT07R-123 TaxID=2733863 RepID=UPI001B209A51|nr:helix-turn-helix domain-containing protein [Catellatospora sp. TT07R-123]GHJ50614.1 hypothetical protein Cs7R123_79560 [Catellatospora sp. TT07R-123]